MIEKEKELHGKGRRDTRYLFISALIKQHTNADPQDFNNYLFH